VNKPPAPPPIAPSPALRLFLYFTAAVTGAAVMIVEILGAKMLAPYVGTSHFVWTAQIAVTLAALATGYFAGGWWADRSPRPGPMYAAILAAAAYLSLTILIVEPLAYGFLRYNLALGSLLASAVLFFVPLALLAMTGPFFIRVLTVTVSGVGGNVGRLSAVGTGGSFLGTLLIGYVLIPYQPNSITMYQTAAALLAVAVLYFLIWGRTSVIGKSTAAVTIIFALSVATFGAARDAEPHFKNIKQIYRANSNFGQLQVVQSNFDNRLFYLNDFLTQNTYDPESRQSTSMFTYMLHGLATLYTPRIDNVLCIGMGAGIVPMQFAHEDVHVDVVEINPAVVPLATQFFDLDARRLNLTIGDGRAYVNASDKQYDAIVLDAFLGDSSPSHLMSRQAFAGMKRLLRPGGVLVINAFCEFEKGKDFYAGSLDKTLKSVFADVRIHAGGNGNVFFVASNQPLKRLREPDLESVHVHCREDAREAYEIIVQTNPQSGIVLTDDYNPVEYYDAANREEYRRYTAQAMQKR
jgi:spermidine synthase